MQLELADVLRCRRVRRPLQKRGEPLATGNVTPLRTSTQLASVHILNHTLAQRADRNRTHRQLLSWMRLTTPRSSRQGIPPAIDNLSSGYRARNHASRLSGLSRSDLVPWPISAAPVDRLRVRYVRFSRRAGSVGGEAVHDQP